MAPIKDKKLKATKSKATKPEKASKSVGSSTQPPAHLMDLVETFLTENDFTDAHRAFTKQRSKKGWVKSQKGADKTSSVDHPSLVTVFQTWQTSLNGGSGTSIQAAVEKVTKVSSSEDESSSSSSSSSRSSNSDSSDSDSDADADVEMEDVAEDDDSSSSESSSSEDSDGESEKEDTKAARTTNTEKAAAANPLKRKAASESRSSSSEDEVLVTKKQKVVASALGSSSDSSSDSSSSDSDLDSGAKTATKPKIVKKSASDSSSDSSSEPSESSSDSSDSDSESSSASDEKAAQVPLPDSDSSSDDSDSSSSSDSDSDSDSGSMAKVPKIDTKKKDTSPTNGSDSSATLGKTSPQFFPVDKFAPLPPDPIKANNRGKKGDGDKQTITPFSRVRKDIQVDPRLASNAYAGHEWGQKAHEDLIVTKGKGFTKEKNKKKKGSYRGGPINTNALGGIKFDD
ncbi:SRP40, C-terminal domain-containing protein [Lasiosphaeria miniovina]|uniref:SRP40, C-terminal domain-containing protein n=1 Tax=Lasiosphaeria miniovina TaxID=1954250 RepID=A0AA40A5J2_9PEZI|nr:SRP40, C-terminal domain-containing protein [Lasiosphaeria miniovina]KAK0709630.1 SRP40, C-terminal domain-containing protein [Lasiosphaeria miniovina]